MSGDNAIKTRGSDRLGRSRFADQLASTLLSETADDGLVVVGARYDLDSGAVQIIA